MTHTKDNAVLHFMKEIRPVASSWLLIYFNLSQLKPSNQTSAMMMQAKQYLEKCLTEHLSSVFLLENNDLIAFVQNVGLLKLEKFVNELRKIFSEDPLTIVTVGKDNFYQTFHMGQSFDALFERIQNMSPIIPKMDLSQHIPLDSAPILPFDLLVRLQNSLKQADISNFIRKQPICWMDSTKIVPKRLGYEYFLSLDGIEEVINSHTHLITDFALFKYLSVLFDKKMLTFLLDINKRIDPKQHFHINLNLRTVVSKEFFEFHNHVNREFVVEIDRTDVLWDLQGFHFACDFLKSYRHRVCLDLIQGPNLKVFSHLELNCDYYKVIANNDLFEHFKEDFQEFVNTVTPDKIILARCESIQIIHNALEMGITQFQGFLIDNVLRQDKKSLQQIAPISPSPTIHP
ncbi:MAG: hypothetical protein K2X98_06035 [Alphaproteobacteria bacterium]|nr:hypothetical protein [Alphaproteobacteria bacterium]